MTLAFSATSAPQKRFSRVATKARDNVADKVISVAVRKNWDLQLAIVPRT